MIRSALARDRVLIIGAGVAGLSVALRLAPLPVTVVSKAPLGAEGSTLWAQGGLAAAVGPEDSPERHAADTLAAGDGLCDPAIVESFAAAAPAAIDWLARLGARLDKNAAGAFALGLEAAHSRRRIVHSGGDGSGREVMRTLVAAARATPSIEILDGVEALRLAVADGRVVGGVLVGPSGSATLASRAVVLATGGVGGLYEFSTNPLGSFGQGLALAARAGARLADLEFVQFHPTALDGPFRPAPLVSEAVRGEGAVLIDDKGERFLAETPGGELAPRDVVARAIHRRIAAGRRVFLDARAALGDRFGARFPAIAGSCGRIGVDPARDPIPVRPAQHYHMGGVAVDADGRASLEGLWACGEVACTGLHGANRLASNSLTEALVFAERVAHSVIAARARLSLARAVAPPPPDPRRARPIVSKTLGVERDGETLRAAIRAFAPLVAERGPSADPAAVALMIAVAALRRQESRGAHARTDFPERLAPNRMTLTLAEAQSTAAEVGGLPFSRSA